MPMFCEYKTPTPNPIIMNHSTANTFLDLNDVHCAIQWLMASVPGTVQCYGGMCVTEQFTVMAFLGQVGVSLVTDVCSIRKTGCNLVNVYTHFITLFT